MKGLRLIVIPMAVLLAGCATSPIPKAVRKQVTPGLTFTRVLQEPEENKGKTVLWGGEILRIKNEPDRTTLHLLQAPTDSGGRPLASDKSEGRFIAVVKRYLDMAVYRPGRKVSVVGKIEGVREEMLAEGQMQYRFPVIAAEEIYLWSVVRRVPGYAYPTWGDPDWDGHWGPRFGTRLGVGYGFSL